MKKQNDCYHLTSSKPNDIGPAPSASALKQSSPDDRYGLNKSIGRAVELRQRLKDSVLLKDVL